MLPKTRSIYLLLNSFQSLVLEKKTSYEKFIINIKISSTKKIPKAISYTSRPETFLFRNKDSTPQKRQHYNILILKCAHVF